jgi:hypothetical protein
MDSLTVTASITAGGLALGVDSDPELSTQISPSLVAALSSTGTDGTLADQVLWFPDRTLSSGSNETHDLTDFVNAVKEAGSSMSKVRAVVVIHSADSAATSITVGNAGTPFPGLLDTATTTRTLKPGRGFSELAPDADGIAVTAGMGIKVAATGGTATYTILVVGES